MWKSGAIVCLGASLASPSESWAGDGRPTPTYTNEDLKRLTPLRGETGVLSKPALLERPEPAVEVGHKGEAYWRKEADRLRARLRPLRRRAQDLRRESLGRQLGSVETERRELEDELLERARRERALPGWLR
jgi:hypothetical protein